MGLVDNIAGVIFDGIETRGDEHHCRQESLATLEQIVQQSTITGELPQVASEISKVMAFLSSKEGTEPAVNALVALGDKMRGTLQPYIDEVLASRAEGGAQSAKEALRRMGVDAATLTAPRDGDTKSAILSHDPKTVEALKSSLDRARSQVGPVRQNKPRGRPR